MNKNWIVFIIGCLILSFQNCASNDSVGESAYLGSPASSFPNFSKLSILSSIATNIPISNIEVYSRTGTLKVQLDSGVVSKVTPQKSETVISCVLPVQMEELRAYSKKYNLCEVDRGSFTAETVCTQEYRAGYASLSLDGQKLNLGESYDGCGKGFVDFCGSQGEAFHNLVSALLVQCL